MRDLAGTIHGLMLGIPVSPENAEPRRCSTRKNARNDATIVPL